MAGKRCWGLGLEITSLVGYENRQAQLQRVVTIHTARCGYCADGKGNADTGNPKTAKWHGPFASLEHTHRELRKVDGTSTRLHECIKTPKPSCTVQ